MERAGEIRAEEALRWKHGIFGLMELWGLEEGDVASCCPGGTDSL
jgi:hypothetical protein